MPAHDTHRTRHSAYTEDFSAIRDQTDDDLINNIEYMEKWTSEALKITWRRHMQRKYLQEARRRGLM